MYKCTIVIFKASLFEFNLILFEMRDFQKSVDSYLFRIYSIMGACETLQDHVFMVSFFLYLLGQYGLLLKGGETARNICIYCSINQMLFFYLRQLIFREHCQTLTHEAASSIVHIIFFLQFLSYRIFQPFSRFITLKTHS